MSHDPETFPTVTHDNIVKLTDLPASAVEGEIGFNSDRSIIEWYEGSKIERPTFVDNDDVRSSTTTVSNTTNETVVERDPINQASLLEGRVLVQRIYGTYSTAASDDAFTTDVYIGDTGFDPTSGEGVHVGTVQTSMGNVSGAPFETETTLTVHTNSATGEMRGYTSGVYNSSPENDNGTGAITIDTTTASEVVMTVTWNNAKSGNTLTVEQAYLEQKA